jgi:hydrogenase expression/formation protein HypC
VVDAETQVFVLKKILCARRPNFCGAAHSSPSIRSCPLSLKYFWSPIRKENSLMCLAVPAKVTAINGGIATVDMMGNTTTADISLLENVSLGDYVMVHVGFAIQKYDEKEAEITLDLLKELAEVTEPQSHEPR